MNVVFTCGGTAGHINPAIAVANIWKERHPEGKVLFIGGDDMEMELVPKAGYELVGFPSASFCRGLNMHAFRHNARAAGLITRAISKCKRVLQDFQADVVIGTGGYASFPALEAARRLHLPTCVHESNAMPGLTTRMACGRGVSPLLTATAMDGGKTSLHERIVLLAKKPRTAALAAIALVLAAALCVGCTFTGAKKEELSGNLGSIAAMMAKLTTDDLSSESVNGYPDIDWEKLVKAINRAAAHEITEEDFQKAEQADLTEGENFHYMVSVSVENGRDLLVSCDTVPADIVHVMDPTAALSSVSIPNGTQTSAYFRDHDLYELVRQNGANWNPGTLPEDNTPEVELIPADRLGTLPSRAVLTTQTFIYEDLTLEVTDVYYTGKGLVREDETQVFENNYFVVCPGATFTVVSGGAENDSNGVPHANWKYYDPFGGTVELTPGSGPYEITLNSSIGRDNFPVLLFNQFEGWLQEPAADPVEVVRKAIEADAQKPATLSTRVISAALDETETARIVEMYSDGDLARSRGWTNELLADHFVTVKAVYEAQYDGTKTFLDSGTITEFFYLTQYNDGRWRIVDNGVRSVQR